MSKIQWVQHITVVQGSDWHWSLAIDQKKKQKEQEFCYQADILTDFFP